MKQSHHPSAPKSSRLTEHFYSPYIMLRRSITPINVCSERALSGFLNATAIPARFASIDEILRGRPGF
jgi:hypothetical protein